MTINGVDSKATTTSPALDRSHRVRLAGLIVAMALVMAGCVFPPPQPQPSRTYDQAHAFAQVNASRAANGRAALAIDWEATRRAQSWAQHLAAIGSMAAIAAARRTCSQGIYTAMRHGLEAARDIGSRIAQRRCRLPGLRRSNVA